MANLSDKISTAGIPDASDTVSGLVNTTTQTFAGAKTFEGEVTVTNSSGLSLNPGAGASAQLIFKENDTVMWQAYNSQADDSFKLYQGAGGGVALSVDTSRNFNFQNGDLTTTGVANFDQLTFPDSGSASAWNIHWGGVGNAGMGISQIGTNIMGFYIANTETMRVDSAGVDVTGNLTTQGSIGCGDAATSPSFNVGLSGIDIRAAAPAIRLEDTDVSKSVEMYMNGANYTFNANNTGMNSVFSGFNTVEAVTNNATVYSASAVPNDVLLLHNSQTNSPAQNGNNVSLRMQVRDISQVAQSMALTTESHTNAQVRFAIQTNGTTDAEIATFLSNGNVGIGTSIPSRDLELFSDAATGSAPLKVVKTNGSDFTRFVEFVRGTTAVAGYIRRVGGTSAVEFEAGSDRRIKTEILPMDNTLDKLCAVELTKFKYKEDNSPGYGPVAQQLADIFPDKVYSTDDGIGEELPEGVEPWTVGHSWQWELMKAIQELSAEVEALKNA